MPPEDLLRRFVGRLISRRNELNWSQSELARRAGVPQATISLLERGSTYPRLETLGKIAIALGYEADEMIAARTPHARY